MVNIIQVNLFCLGRRAKRLRYAAPCENTMRDGLHTVYGSLILPTRAYAKQCCSQSANAVCISCQDLYARAYWQTAESSLRDADMRSALADSQKWLRPPMRAIIFLRGACNMSTLLCSFTTVKKNSVPGCDPCPPSTF